jgi:hypothetical protein
MKLRAAAGMLALLLGVGCQASSEAQPAPEKTDWVACEDPRPQMCTHEYRPVCAARDNGVRCVTTPCDSTDARTYGNACSACADPKVISYVPGACKDAD